VTRLQAGGMRKEGFIPGKRTDLFLHYIIETGSRAHPASYPLATGGYFHVSIPAGA
jgi:hypothetical protein